MIKFVIEPGYYELSDSDKASICNGAGAAGDWKSALIPNTMYGLDCTEAFNLHDYAYHVGATLADKDRADISMLINLIRIINNKGGMLSIMRKYRAVSYYEAVHSFGTQAFFVGKTT